MKLDIELLKKISETPGAPGFESKIRELIIDEVESVVDDIYVDNLGNLTCKLKGKSAKRLMLAAHMDEIGFIVSHVDSNGFLKFHPLGGFDPKTLTAQRVVVHGKKDLIGVMGSKPIHVMKPEEKKKTPEISDYFIDLGMSKEEVEKYVEVGTPVTRKQELIEIGDCINGKSLDNRISVFVLIEALKKIKKQELPYDTYAVFTVQEEVGIRGAMVAAQEIQPDFGIAIDTTIAFDTPGAPEHEKITTLGEGVAIKIMDSATIADTRMVKLMKEIADKNKLKRQLEILPAGGTDTAYLQRMVKSGSIAGAVSIPTRHIHQSVESVHKTDVKNAIKLVAGLITELDLLDLNR